jgi:hypothetical protein
MLAIDSRARPASRRGPGPGLVVVPSSVGTSRQPRIEVQPPLSAGGPFTGGPFTGGLSPGGRATARRFTSRPRLRAASPSTYRRRRALAAGVVVAVSALATLVLGALGGGSLTAPERPLPAGTGAAGAVYVVQPGDTFWSIARQVSPEPQADLRPMVDRLVAEHGGSTLLVGEPIRLPLRT